MAKKVSEKSPNNKEHKFAKRAKALWNYFSVYEKIWYISILVLAIVFAFIFPEEDTPTQMLELNSATFSQAEGEYTTLDFDGTTGVFVIDAIYVAQGNGEFEEYALLDYPGEVAENAYSEHTVDPSLPETLKLPLPVAVNKDSKIKFDCYQDSDDGELVVSIVNNGGATLVKQTITLEEGNYDGYTVSNNTFLVSAAIIMSSFLL